MDHPLDASQYVKKLDCWKNIASGCLIKAVSLEVCGPGTCEMREGLETETWQWQNLKVGSA